MAKKKPNGTRSKPKKNKVKLAVVARWIQEQLDEHMLSEKLIERILKLEQEYCKKFIKK